MTVSIDSAPIAAALAQANRRLAESRFADALWSRRLDIWPSDPAAQASIANRLGWLTAFDSVSPHLDRLRACAASIRTGGITDVVLLGMGGSSLAPEVLRAILGTPDGHPRLQMLDSTAQSFSSPSATGRPYRRRVQSLAVALRNYQ